MNGSTSSHPIIASSSSSSSSSSAAVPSLTALSILNPLSSPSIAYSADPTSFPKRKIKVLLLEKISPSAVSLFAREGFHVETCDKSLAESELIERIPAFHALGLRSKTQLSERVLAAASKLLVCGAFCIGTDQVDLISAAKSGVAVFNAPFANTRSVAELILGEMIALARQFVDRSTECHKGEWKKKSSGCYELRGKTLAIIGYGHVGSQLSILAEAFGMRILFFDIVPKLPLGLASACENLEAAIQGADFVSLHVPATESTENLIGEKEIAKMKPGSFLLNAARGKVVDLHALRAAIVSGHLAGAAIDVFPLEPSSSEEKLVSPLQGLSNVILTPHIGGSTEEAQVAIGVEVASKMITYINTGSSTGAVNLPELALAPHKSSHRILNIHHNVPGVLRDVNSVLADYNVVAQLLMTLGPVGYLIVDVEKAVSQEVKQKITAISKSIKTRLLY